MKENQSFETKSVRRRSLVLLALGAGLALLAGLIPKKSMFGARRTSKQINITENPHAVKRAKRNVNV